MIAKLTPAEMHGKSVDDLVSYVTGHASRLNRNIVFQVGGRDIVVGPNDTTDEVKASIHQARQKNVML